MALTLKRYTVFCLRPVTRATTPRTVQRFGKRLLGPHEASIQDDFSFISTLYVKSCRDCEFHPIVILSTVFAMKNGLPGEPYNNKYKDINQ